MALGLLRGLCTSEQAGEITVSMVMTCRFRVVAEQEPACLVADRNLEASVWRVAIAADGPAVSRVVLLACSALPVGQAYGPPWLPWECTTRWQGSTTGSGLVAQAVPAARTALG
jgi:hypothetical protein